MEGWTAAIAFLKKCGILGERNRIYVRNEEPGVSYVEYSPDHQARKVFNNWLHKYIYKKDYDNVVGQQLRKLYENAKIQTEQNFKEALKHVLSDC